MSGTLLMGDPFDLPSVPCNRNLWLGWRWHEVARSPHPRSVAESGTAADALPTDLRALGDSPAFMGELETRPYLSTFLPVVKFTFSLAPESGWGLTLKIPTALHAWPPKTGSSPSTSADGHSTTKANWKVGPGNQTASPSPRTGGNSVASLLGLSVSHNSCQHPKGQRPQKYSQRRQCV